MKSLISLVLLLMVPQMLGAHRRSEGRRTLSGVIYFTNNTPPDLEKFPIELFTRDEKNRLFSTTPDSHHNFTITVVQPDEYILKLTWPGRCTLRYRVDVRKESLTRIRVVMDAACAHDKGEIRQLDEN